ncbi:Lon protease family protein [Magnetospira sp. QH-2]|uniref:Lon protease family protein n=1 Tax=Magnetospira sp. (strain QH-2) TaxID=1288970 RepID=UPI0003E81AD9|nr:ATP-binding protein [Magnetospira sp. QH-2]CCQ75386.1 putative ATP-dependent protease [Magnetospira sp. QH-2]
MTKLKPIAPAPLDASRLYTLCDPESFPFTETGQLDPLEDFIGQDRAVAAVRFAMDMDHHGYNLFALGPQGTGKQSLVRRFLEQTADSRPVPGDWCYVHNFDDPHKPRAISLPASQGQPLVRDMDGLIEDLRSALPAAFEGETFQNHQQAIEDEYKKHQEDRFSGFQDQAAERDVALLRTPMGLALAPLKDGEVLSSDDFKALPEEDQDHYRRRMADFQSRLEEMMAEMPRWEKEKREKLRALTKETTQLAVGHLIDALREKWADRAQVLTHLETVRDQVVEDPRDFLPLPDGSPEEAAGRGASLRRFKVNLLVDNGGPRRGAPVVEEEHPTLGNLLGRVEQVAQQGTLMTDFNLIKPGALHRANGGFLILDARRLLMQPLAWEALKRALRGDRIRIESAAEAWGFAGTVTLEPEPIPLDVKVVLVGDPMLHYLLSAHDPEFAELFKVAADFDDRMPRTEEYIRHYARLIAGVCNKEKLPHLDAAAVARVIEQCARLAGDSERLSAHMSSIVDLVREAAYWARSGDRELIGAEQIQQAIDAREFRSDRIRDRIQEEIARGTLLVETEGARVGQVNGLAVLQMNDFAFGKPSRISARVRPGRGEVIDIEREVALGGPLHSKGVLILASFLNHRYGADRPLSLAATLVFEQSYGGIEGDSASSTELYVLLSAIAEIPIKQGLAVTGSVDSFGRVQAIGGVNEKIEGFFDVCKAKGLTGEQGVLIPAANVKHLMLRHDVVAAAREGRFHIYPVETIDEGIERLTGIPAGQPDDDGDYPLTSVNRAVGTRLQRMARRMQDRERSAPPIQVTMG